MLLELVKARQTTSMYRVWRMKSNYPVHCRAWIDPVDLWSGREQATRCDRPLQSDRVVALTCPIGELN